MGEGSAGAKVSGVGMGASRASEAGAEKSKWEKSVFKRKPFLPVVFPEEEEEEEWGRLVLLFKEF